ncbi:hypothetical protein PFICI_03469 [Pestalotiopsis fici W106-1]|uniref:Uncharacterized protein n=1 Tax=Pestalotiopsis fici (strain W106-1 / CGMCC3.15140) TaxID=1229662 RepID=W3XHH3_PESFW|nr:uncharacterized protein PFICI_03469 [Pestalotiopsis fici W106-1]ETS85444.1 hypothetical protein PFICI_03469 [Pestalotiopsis fici W106-1]
MDPNVSNGTCYFTQNTETKGSFIPCGNVALGHWPCCHTGDFCLSFDKANACYDPETGNTYLAGCTDAGFNDPACPWKSPQFNQQEWVAIHQCQIGTGSNDTKWGGCETSENSTELERLPNQSCDPYCSTILFEGNTALPAYASLPNSTGSSIAWTSGFEPTAVYNPTTIATEVSGTQVTITSIQTRPLATSPTGTATQSTPTSTTVPPTAASSEGLSTGAKAGIGVGAAGAALLFVATMLLFLLFRRRKRQAKANQDENLAMQHQPDLSNRQYAYPSYQAGETTQLSPKPWPQELAAGARNDFKSELPANEGPVTCELAADHSTTPHEHLFVQQQQQQQQQHGSHYTQAPSPNSPYSTLGSSGTDQVSYYSGTTAGYDGNRYGNAPETARYNASFQNFRQY